MLKDQSKIVEYDKEVKSLIDNGIAEIVPNTESPRPIYYMPHKPVYKENKSTTKVRIVFDASSSESGHISLNDHLSEGSNLIADLFTMLLRFRANRIAVVGDIEKAFLQILLDEADRDTHRFLWYKSCPSADQHKPDLAIYRMTRVTFGITSSPFLLASTIRNHFDESLKSNSLLCEKLKASFYVDDLIFSEPTKEAAMHVAKQAQTVMEAAKFNLRKWNSNDVDVRRELSTEEVGMAEQKILGLAWCTVNDKISVDVKSCNDYIQTLRATKRNVLKAMAKIYDPLGLLGPFTVRIKILLQEVWRQKKAWDVIMDGETQSAFSQWQEELALLETFCVDRCLSAGSESILELHIFSDASPKAYGAVAYCRQIMPTGRILTNIVCSKNRVSPISENNKEVELTLPKLELTAALMAARLKETLVKSLCVKISAVCGRIQVLH
ncbi:uncharacterized protein LOC118749114 [Rhagoletis pomonella]|uniref:uncharacterized protein LOC118749114 n=1 Tax=Rhagoletis pomonella TaxID=28610 RepID=UPI001781D8E1|nr:uncharacterized protein LOC118749114 [Rhagoletis pomonella]